MWSSGYAQSWVSVYCNSCKPRHLGLQWKVVLFGPSLPTVEVRKVWGKTRWRVFLSHKAEFHTVGIILYFENYFRCLKKTQIYSDTSEEPNMLEGLWKKSTWRVTLGFLRGWNGLFYLLGCYAAWGGLIPTFRDDLLVPSSRIKLSKTTDWTAPKRRYETTLRCVTTKKTK